MAELPQVLGPVLEDLQAVEEAGEAEFEELVQVEVEVVGPGQALEGPQRVRGDE